MSDEAQSRPRMGTGFYKAHGLGNDYLVFEEGDAWTATPDAVGRVCDRWRGPGGDGIVVLLADPSSPATGYPAAPFRLRMFNPDGSEFERSGNGLRVLASYLARRGRVDTQPFSVEVGGDLVTMTVHGSTPPVHDVSVEMGRARVGPAAVALDPAALDPEGRLELPGGERVAVRPVSVGNPHLVVFTPEPTREQLLSWGPALATHRALARGSNVQIAAVVDGHACRALIWERGVGRTSASGTSSCAVAVAAVSAGLVEPGAVTVHMDGGDLSVTVSRRLDVVLRGPVEEVCEGTLTEAFVKALPAA
ncbi:MAG: diaminopimelate epimerase [Gemmatimonadetes bacterium]|nr:diaminopimelate epimerase [Gemmatimonadota bacterium]